MVAIMFWKKFLIIGRSLLTLEGALGYFWDAENSHPLRVLLDARNGLVMQMVFGVEQTREPMNVSVRAKSRV